MGPKAVNPVLLDSISTWADLLSKERDRGYQPPRTGDSEVYAPDEILNAKVSLWDGDSTRLGVDAIVNAANTGLRGGGGIDGAIHRKAGKELLKELIRKYPTGCKTGDAVITKGYNLPSKYVIHTPGPVGEKPNLLELCYKNVLSRLVENELRSVAFCSISTGIYGYPIAKAARVALSTVRRWLESEGNAEKVDRIIFVVYGIADYDVYFSEMQRYFPSQGNTPSQDR